MLRASRHSVARRTTSNTILDQSITQTLITYTDNNKGGMILQSMILEVDGDPVYLNRRVLRARARARARCSDDIE